MTRSRERFTWPPRASILKPTGSGLTALLFFLGMPAFAQTPTNISALWANEGGDKVTQDELRASKGIENKTGTVKNRVWDGVTINLSGARNESVSFNLVLEAATNAAPGVSVSFDTLTGPNGAKIQSTKQATGSEVFNWVGRPVELFYMKYLQIKGLSAFGWYRGNENQLPARFARPNTNGSGVGGWADRPDHDKFYPDILVPLELVPTFTVAAKQNQSIWSDVYIPKGTPAGTYTGSVTVEENGTVTHSVPVSLTVEPFSLPDTPSVKGVSNLDAIELEWRYSTGVNGYANWQTSEGKRVRHISDVYYQFFHRHRIDLISGETEVPNHVGIHPLFKPRYDGSLYTAANGYDGPGVGVGTSIYVIGPYGSWGRNIFDKQTMWNFADPTADWFASNMPNLPYFIYLQDEPTPNDYPNVENWAKWLAQDPGNGHNMLSMSTAGLTSANAYMPDLDIVAESNMMGDCPVGSPNNCDNTAFTGSAVATLKAKPNRQLWEYGGSHPGAGTSNTEDDGVAMRTWPWIQSKLGIDRWFFWYANLNSQQADWFQSACTWGCDSHSDSLFGQVSPDNYTNGDGVLIYPGSDVTNKQDSFGVDGPFASLRLKEWRRGTEDADYLALAKQIDPAGTAAILAKVMPAAMWENHAPGWPNGDPSYFNNLDSWSSNPDDWEAARAQLAAIIVNSCTSNPSASYCQ